MASGTFLMLSNIDRLSGGLHVKLKFYGIRGGTQSLIHVQTWTLRWFKMTLKPTHGQHIQQKFMKFASYVPYPIFH